jgi:FlaA1/EpsC-like NDP-sugar epimerase
MEGKTILVTGGAGSIGSEIVRQLVGKNDVYVIDYNETALFDLYEELKHQDKGFVMLLGDIRDRDIFNELSDDSKFDYIFHAAALKHVTPSEKAPMEYVKTNIGGTYNIMEYAWKTGARLVNISTDKVVHANSIMGATKKVAEIMVRNARQVSVRFGNVMGSRGSVIPIWQKQLEEGRPLTVTDDKMTRFMMTIPQAVNLVIEASQKAKDGETWILKMGEPVNVLQLAKDILKKADKEDLGVKMIGVRPGETMDEKLWTEEEYLTIRQEGNFYIL